MGMIEDMSSGSSGRMTVRLSPGTYVLFCNVPGHYAAGQHTTFTVTSEDRWELAAPPGGPRAAFVMGHRR
jgi:hypothetical protein